MKTSILKLNKTGVPVAWLNYEEAATAIAKNLVLWSLGGNAGRLHGGTQRSGERTIMDIPPIIAFKGKVIDEAVPRLDNTLLFARDQHICLYCGERFHRKDLSRDHVKPRSKGGKDCWTNVVCACRRCNNFKCNRTPEQAGMKLLAIPYAPNRHEMFYLRNHNILEDQMEFLKPGFKNLMVA